MFVGQMVAERAGGHAVMGMWDWQRLRAPRVIAYGAVGVLIAAGSVLTAPAARAATGIPLLDPPRLLATIPVGDGAFGVALNPISGRVYVANRDDDSVSVINPSDNSVIATIPVAPTPDHIAVNPLSGRVYVLASNFTSGADHSYVQVIDPSSNTVSATIPIGFHARDIAINQLSGKIYVPILSYANPREQGKVVVIDPNNNSVTTTIPVSLNPEAIAVNSVTGTAYVADSQANTVQVIDPISNKVTATIPVGAYPRAVTVSPLGRVYVSNYDGNSMSVIDPLTNTVAATVPVGWGPVGAVVNPLTSEVYVADSATNPSPNPIHGDTVAIIDPLTNTVSTYIPTGDAPEDVDINPLTGRAYVANFLSDTVSVIGR